MKRKGIQPLNNEKGQITMDFLFACVLVLGVSVLLGALTFALTLTEVIQYVSFAGARSYYAADVNEDMQQQAAAFKVRQLVKLPFLADAIDKGWISAPAGRAGDFTDYGKAIAGDQGTKNQFWGYQFSVTFPILNLKLPLLGQVVSSPQGDAFSAKVSSFLMREPTESECISYNKQMYQAIIGKGGYGQATQRASVQPPQVLIINDNGC